MLSAVGSHSHSFEPVQSGIDGLQLGKPVPDDIKALDLPDLMAEIKRIAKEKQNELLTKRHKDEL